jgi:hypothetical protein
MLYWFLGQMEARMRLTSILSATALLVTLTTGASAETSVKIKGVISAGSLDSTVGDYGFLTKSAIGDAIFANCKMGDVCQVEAYVDGEMIKAIVSAKKASAPPPSDAVFDTRSACLYGSMEGEDVPAKKRLLACSELGELESQALDAGYCWNQMAGSYKECQ